MLTRSRGRDGKNVVAMIVGITSVLILCKVALPRSNVSGLRGEFQARRLELRLVHAELVAERSPGPGSFLCRCLVTVCDQHSLPYAGEPGRNCRSACQVDLGPIDKRALEWSTYSAPRHFLGGEILFRTADEHTRRLSHRANAQMKLPSRHHHSDTKADDIFYGPRRRR